MNPLVTILLKAGAPILVDIVKTALPEPVGRVVEAVADSIGVEKTAEAIVEAHARSPQTVEAAVREVAEASPEMWQYLATAAAGQAALLARDDAREAAFSWAWRPAMSWLLMILWVWNGVVLPVANAFGTGIAPIPWEQLIGFSGLWLAIYGGGHTVKQIWGGK